MRQIHFSISLLALAGVVLLNACADRQIALDSSLEEPGLAADTQPVELVGATPAFPTPGSMDRLVAVDKTINAWPKDVLLQSPKAVLEPSLLQLPSEPGGTCWAIWGWYGLGQYPWNDFDSVQIELAPDEGEYWVLLPDFLRRSWRIEGPFSESQIKLPPRVYGEQQFGSWGTFYVGVLTYDGSKRAVDRIQLIANDDDPEEQKRRIWYTYARDDSDHLTVRLSSQLEDDRWLYRWYRNQVPSEKVRLAMEADEWGYDDFEVTAGALAYYQVFEEAANGQLYPVSPLALGVRSPSSGHILSGSAVYDKDHEAEGVELYLDFANLYTSSDFQGHFSFPSLADGTYSLFIVEGGAKIPVGTYVIDGADVVTEDVIVTISTVPAHNWYWLHPPTGLAIEALNEHSARLSWQAAKWATDYEVYRCRFSDLRDPRLVGNTTGLSLEMEHEPAGLNYYIVRALDHDFSSNGRRSGWSDPVSFTSNQPPGLQPDTIYATADRYMVAPGEKVRITVFCHETAHALLFPAVRLTYQESCSYVPGTFNLGLPGGAAFAADGIWLQVGSEGFLEVPDSLLMESEQWDDQVGIDFVVVPIKGDSIEQATGAILNIELEVWHDTYVGISRGRPNDGVYHTNATWYQADDNVRHYWTHDYNDLMPMIDVVEE